MVVADLTKKTVRVAKSVTKGYSSTQSKVRNATKNDPSSPTTRELNEIADLSFNNVDFIEIMEVLDKRLNDKGKSWRHVFKALNVLEYLLFWGPETIMRYCQANLYEIKTLREFQYIDDNGIDCGMNVRQKAKDITNLVLNPNLLKSKRRRNGQDDYQGGSHGVDDFAGERRGSPHRSRPNPDNDEDVRRAMAESRRQKRRSSEDEDLQRALQLSKEEEERRQRDIASSNSNLFNDLAAEQPKNDTLIDLSDIQIGPSAPLQVQYTQYQPVQPQYTVQPQFTQLQPQYTQFQAPYQYQIDEALQAEYLRQQAEWAQQQQIAAQQQAQQQAEWAQQQQLAAQQEEYARQQSILQWQQQQQQYQQPSVQQPIQPQPTAIGSNNPFAAPSPAPSLSSTDTASSRMSPPSTPYSTRSLSRASDTKHSHLAGLFANRTGPDGVDTFGNTGFLRYGPTDTGRLAAHRTGLLGNGSSYAF